jgi:tetratricopeptide (TPR) repeat protein
MKAFFVALLSLGLALTARDLPPKYAEARSLYYRGADGDTASYETAEQLFHDLASTENPSPLILSYYGSLQLWEASHTWAVWKKNSLSKEGIQKLDRAVNAAPDDLEVRFVRAVTTYRLPSFFHRREQCASDFDLLSKQAPQAAKDGRLEARLAAASLYYHAEFLSEASKDKDAIALWRQAVQLAPDSRAARESEAELSKRSVP